MRKINLDGNVTKKLTEGGDGVSVVRRAVFQVKGNGWTGSFVLKQVLAGSDLAAADYKNVPYTNRTTSASVAAGTAINADGIYEVDANGVDIYAVHTDANGDVDVYVNAMDG